MCLTRSVHGPMTDYNVHGGESSLRMRECLCHPQAGSKQWTLLHIPVIPQLCSPNLKHGAVCGNVSFVRADCTCGGVISILDRKQPDGGRADPLKSGLWLCNGKYKSGSCRLGSWLSQPGEYLAIGPPNMLLRSLCSLCPVQKIRRSTHGKLLCIFPR
jgi:hypothetical protein